MTKQSAIFDAHKELLVFDKCKSMNGATVSVELPFFQLQFSRINLSDHIFKERIVDIQKVV